MVWEGLFFFFLTFFWLVLVYPPEIQDGQEEGWKGWLILTNPAAECVLPSSFSLMNNVQGMVTEEPALKQTTNLLLI